MAHPTRIAAPDGTVFEGDAGYVLIDLARVPQDMIQDVSGGKGLGEDGWKFLQGNPQNRLDVQPWKDVLRTSEILLEGAIPKNAIVYDSEK